MEARARSFTGRLGHPQIGAGGGGPGKRGLDFGCSELFFPRKNASPSMLGLERLVSWHDVDFVGDKPSGDFFLLIKKVFAIRGDARLFRSSPGRRSLEIRSFHFPRGVHRWSRQVCFFRGRDAHTISRPGDPLLGTAPMRHCVLWQRVSYFLIREFQNL